MTKIKFFQELINSLFEKPKINKSLNFLFDKKKSLTTKEYVENVASAKGEVSALGHAELLITHCEQLNDKELISSAIDVLQGEIEDEDQQKVILSQFVAQFGQEALQDLMQKVQSGEIPSMAQEGDGMVKGAGDGMADMIPANMEGDQDVLLSDGEFVVPADVVSGLGNGSSDAGANKLEDMMDRVRELRTGGKAQPPAVPDEMMLPA